MNDPNEIAKILGSAIRQKTRDENLSQRDIAAATGLSNSTVSRIASGIGKPDADTIAALADYLNIPLERVLQQGETDSVAYFPHESTPDIVQAHLAADPNLSPEDAARLGEIFRTAYNQFAGLEKGDKRK